MSADRIRNRNNIIADIFMAQTRIRLLEAQMAELKEELANLPKEEKKVLLLPPARKHSRLKGRRSCKCRGFFQHKAICPKYGVAPDE